MTLPDPTPRPIDRLPLCGRAGDTALIDRAGSLDFAGLEQAVGRLAAALRNEGLGEGERVASWLAKGRVACLLPLACARAGLVHVPINPLLKQAQARHILEDSGAALLIAGRGRLETLGSGPWRMREEEAAARMAEEGEALPPSGVDPDALAAILYTSGSTGRAKGVMLSHANLWLGAISVAYYLGLGPEDRTLAVLPLSFDYGQNQLFSTWVAGGAVVPLDYLVARDVVGAVERHGITTLAGVPPLWLQLAEASWPERNTLKRLTNSGGRLPVPLVRRLRALLPDAALHSMYGLTEAFRSTSLDPALIDDHPDAIGTAIPFAEVMVVGPDGAPAETGELVHAGPLVAKGYWRDAERTAERFRPAPAWSHFGGTAVWSGDTVTRGGDGLLRFVGRDDEMIKTSGNRVSPTEVEEAAVASGVVGEAVAVGVADERLGEAIRLYVAGEEDPGLSSYLRRELPNFMQPKEIVWRAALPRNANGKLDRAALRAEAGK